MIKHLTRVTVPAGNNEWDLAGFEITDYHKVLDVFGRPVPDFYGRCDSCGRDVVRGVGRWWEWQR